MKAICLLLPLFALPVTAVAGECFCLINQDDHFRHSCVMQWKGHHEVAQCRDDAGKPYKIEDLNGWTRIDDGVGRCNPCKRLPDFGGGDIRNNDSDPQSTKDAPK